MAPAGRAVIARAGVVALVAALAAPAAAQATARLDRAFGSGGHWSASGPLWQQPISAAPDVGGRVFVVDYDGRVMRLTPRGRMDAGWGRRGVVTFGRAGDFSDVALRRWRGATLAYGLGGHTDEDPVVKLLDRRGDPLELGRRVDAAVGGADSEDHLLPRPGGGLLDIHTHKSSWTTRTIDGRGRVRPLGRIPLPRDISGPVGLRATPVRSGGGALIAGHRFRGITDSYAIMRITAAGGLDRRWGTHGFKDVPALRALLPWRGGAVVVGDRDLRWLDRRGRTVAVRRLRADAAAFDAAGRLVLARSASDRRRVSVLRLRADRTVDRGFGRVSITPAGRTEPLAVVPQRGGRVVVVAAQVVVDLGGGGIREDFGVFPRGTIAWRLRTR